MSGLFKKLEGPDTSGAEERANRLDHFIEEIYGDAAERYPVLAKFTDVLTPVFKGLSIALCFAIPVYAWLFKVLYKLYLLAPKNVIKMVFGGVLCFFGGTFVASLAAAEAFIQMGGKRFYGDIQFVASQAQIVFTTVADEDDDEKLTVELLREKCYLALTKVKEPARLEQAFGNLWSAYTAMLASLSLQFAQTTAMALGMADTLYSPVGNVLSPVLVLALGADAKQWVQPIVRTTVNVGCIAFAWYLQMILSAVYSGLRGGHMFASALFNFLADDLELYDPRDRPSTPPVWWQKLLDPKSSMLDEIIAYGLAGFGAYTQIFSGFSIIFPLNIVLLPLTWIEWFLRLQISLQKTDSSTS